MDNPEHTPLGLRPALRLVEADPVYRRDDVVVDRSEGRDQTRNAIGAAGVFIPPWTLRMKAQHITGKITRFERAGP